MYTTRSLSTRTPVSSMMTAFPRDPDELVESWTGVAVDRLDHRLDTRSVGKFLHAIVERTYQAETLGTQLQHRKHNQQLSRRNQPRLSSEPGASQACNNELVKLKGTQIFFLWKEILVYIYIYIIRKCNCNYSSMLKWCLENK